MIKKQAFINANIFTADKILSNKVLLVEGNKVANIISKNEAPQGFHVVDLEGALLTPSFVDLQVNGGGGVLLNENSDVDALKKVLDANASCGSSHIFPTVFTAEPERMKQLLRYCVTLRENGDDRIAGIHFEGPIINPEKPGIHNIANIRRADDEILDIYLAAASKLPTLVTLAPEMVDIQIITRLCEAGVMIFAGHSCASYEQMQQASSAGVRGVTHLYNACSSLTAREPGIIGYALTSDASYFSIIVDGFHVHYACVAAALKNKPPGKAFLVSDAMPPLGTNQTSFKIDETDIIVKDGRCQTQTGKLAGSATNLSLAIKNCVNKVGIDKLEAVKMASQYPAYFANIGDKIGQIAVNNDANFNVLDKDMNMIGVYNKGEKIA